jgi:outer membrane immunogenic protein
MIPPIRTAKPSPISHPTLRKRRGYHATTSYSWIQKTSIFTGLFQIAKIFFVTFCDSHAALNRACYRRNHALGKHMKVIGAISSLMILAASPVLAADMAVKARPVVAPIVAYNWSGCYIGGFVGGATRERDYRVTDIGSVGQGGTFPLYDVAGTNPHAYGSDSSFIGGGTLGCNWQGAGSPFVVGIEGEAGYLRLRGAAFQPTPAGIVPDVLSASKTGDWYAVAAGRLGYAVDRVLLYVKGGVAFYDTSATIVDVSAAPPGVDTITAAGSKSQVTYAVGGGIEYAFTNNWTLKGEYLYLGRGDSYLACGRDANVAQTFCWNQEPSGIHTAKLGLNYKFGWGGPVVAKY